MTFNGEKQEPAVTVKDDNGFVIDGSEYTVAYLDENNNSDLIQVGTYTLTITEVSGGNYTFDGTAGKNTATFEITPAGQTPLTITGTRERVYYGDTIHQHQNRLRRPDRHLGALRGAKAGDGGCDGGGEDL